MLFPLGAALVGGASAGSGVTGCAGEPSFALESLLRRVGGPVGVRAGRWMGGGLGPGCGDGDGDGDGGLCLAELGEGGRVRGLGLSGGREERGTG